MSEPLWILGMLFGFAIMVRLFSYVYELQHMRRSLQKEINASTQTLLDCMRKAEWLESRMEDLLDAAQLQSCDVNREQKRLDQLIDAIKTEGMQNGYRLGLSDLDQTD